MTAAALELEQGQVDVWHASLEQPAAVLVRLGGLLSADERRRAAEFRFERDRRRYVAGRALLRTLLSWYTGEAPESIAFRYGEFRKPALASGGPQFNISHSGALAVFAFSGSVEIGVDIELAAAQPDGDRIAEHFFSPAEVRHLRSLAPAARDLAFLECWTRKEAFLKARGDGLTLPLDAFDVSFGPDRPAELLRTAWSADEPDRWALIDLSDPAAGYVAALASPDPDCVAVTRHWGQARALPGADGFDIDHAHDHQEMT